MTDDVTTVDGSETGIYLTGGFLGREEGREWNPEPGRTVTIRPKIGLRVDGEEVAVECKDDAAMAELTRGWVKGDIVTVQVEVQPPSDYRGPRPVRFALPGAIEAVARNRWK